MNAKRFALISGLLYVVIGLLSFLPSLSTLPTTLPRLRLEASYGLFLGVFPQNVINKVALTAFGLAGLIAYQSGIRHSLTYARAVFLVMGLAAVLGAFPLTNTFFGFWPLWGYEALLHGANALLGGYFGFATTAKAEPHVTRA